MSRPMLTREELDAILPPLKRSIAATEAEHPEARPLPPMTAEECLERFERLMDAAATRPLTLAECFLHGQLLACYRHAIRAETLGHEGRFFVIPEDDIRRLGDGPWPSPGGGPESLRCPGSLGDG
jgi:hypothetical protein